MKKDYFQFDNFALGKFHNISSTSSWALHAEYLEINIETYYFKGGSTLIHEWLLKNKRVTTRYRDKYKYKI